MNSTLISRIFTDNVADAEVLDQWLEERDIDKTLREHSNEPLPFSVDAERLGKIAAPYDAKVEPGQIRILPTDLISDDTVFPYVAVLDRWMEDIWLVAPFSPYSFPATDGEMATGIPLVGQRVLQCWNARTAHECLIGKSYVMGALDEKVRNDALALFRHVSAGAELPADFSALVGSPILSKADPRSEYLVESAVRYEPLTRAAQKLEAKFAVVERIAERKTQILQSAWFIHTGIGDAQQLALAAGDKTKETSRTIPIPALGVEIDIKHSPSEGKARLVVYGQDGLRDSNTLEGFVVVDKDGSPVGLIEDGVLIVEAAALTEKIQILDPESLMPVIPSEN